MAKKTIAELLQEAKVLRQQERDLKARMKAQKNILATEYIDNMPEAEKQKQIAEAEKILATAKAEAEQAKAMYRQTIKKIKNDVAFAKEILSFVNYKQNHSLLKVKNAFSIDGDILTFKREGIKDITVNVAKANWQQEFKKELAKQGINGENRIADNIVYKATQLLKTHTINA